MSFLDSALNLVFVDGHDLLLATCAGKRPARFRLNSGEARRGSPVDGQRSGNHAPHDANSIVKRHVPVTHRCSFRPRAGAVCALAHRGAASRRRGARCPGWRHAARSDADRPQCTVKNGAGIGAIPRRGPLRALGSPGLAWLAAGGLFYTGGIVFYALDTRLAHAHGVWHLFVIAGSAAHNMRSCATCFDR
ncbi:MAG: hemolysin III family protein [Betaproteobacteria bacterium]|nr:hemolysin III family protein [Betaproteobacteria bacterium]